MKRTVFHFRLAALVAFLASFSYSFAVPAKRGLITVRQADGTELQVQIVGDEHSHYYLSEDGYLLLNDGDIYYYAQVDSGGSFIKSPMAARPAGLRSEEARSFLGQVDKAKTVSAMKTRSEELRNVRRAKALQASSPRRTRIGLFDTGFPATGVQKGLAVLVEYTDVKFRLDDPYDYFNRMLNETGFSDNGATGSAAEYFRTSSNGQFQPEFDVYGPVTLSHNMSYYGANGYGGDDMRPYLMPVEACELLDGEVDFSQYDRDGDGFIDMCYVFYAGEGEATGGGSNTVWPHSWNVTSGDRTPHVFDGVQLDKYACSNEWEHYEDRPCGIGTFVHEFSHVLGLPDLYATDYTSAFTPGEWTVLDQGSYNNNSHTPPLYTVYERYSLGWIEPTVIDGPADISLESIGNNVGCIIPTGDENEFFLLENRQQTGWDEYIPGHGMLVWHVDYDLDVWTGNTVNNLSSHQYVDIEEADNRRTEATRSGDSFPGTGGVTSFTDDTRPSMKTWAGKKLGLPITEITETGGIVSFKVAGGGVNSAVRTAVVAERGVRLAGRTLIVNAPAGENVAVSDALGRTVFSALSDGNTISMPLTTRGIIIVKIGEQSFKVVR